MMIIVGIDVGKKELLAALSDAEGSIIRGSKLFSNNKSGFKKLWKWVVSCGSEQGINRYHMCLESTGVYGEEVSYYFSSMEGFTVSVVNPSQIYAYARASLKRTKNDVVDAELIARFCATQRPDAWKPESGVIRRLREILRHIEALKKMRTEELNRLESMNHRFDPCKEVIKSIKKHIAVLDKQIMELEKDCRNTIDKDPGLKNDHELLKTIPGIADISGFWLLAEIGSTRRDYTIKQLAAHSGLSPRERSSGSSVRGKTSIAKAGNKRLRRSLYMPAMVAIRYNPIVKSFYERLCQKGKPKKIALVAAMKKLLHIAFGVLKNQKAFDPDFA